MWKRYTYITCITCTLKILPFDICLLHYNSHSVLFVHTDLIMLFTKANCSSPSNSCSNISSVSCSDFELKSELSSKCSSSSKKLSSVPAASPQSLMNPKPKDSANALTPFQMKISTFSRRKKKQKIDVNVSKYIRK